jgi:DHA2 family lincomycin resistance protein-like MFS transporter
MLPGGVINAVVSAIAGRFSDLVSPKLLILLGYGTTIIGLILLMLTRATSPMWYVIIGHIVVMIGAPLAMSPSQTFGLSALNQATSSDGSTIMNTFQQIIGAVATAIATSLLAFGQQLSNGGHQVAFTTGFHVGLMFTLIVAIVAFLVALTIRNPRQTN